VATLLSSLVAAVTAHSEQHPLYASPTMSNKSKTFEFKQGPGIFSPNDLVELPRPGKATANNAGDLAIVPSSQYSAKEKK